MGRTTRSLVVVAMAACLMAMAVSASATPVRVEGEIMPTFPSALYEFGVAHCVVDTTASGNAAMAESGSWIYIENIVAPATGYYDITYRVKSNFAGDTTATYLQSFEWGGMDNWSFGDPSVTTWYDYHYSTWLAEGANRVEIGAGNSNFYLDYIEWDDSLGLSFVAAESYRPFRIEAESATLGANMSVVANSTASGGSALAFQSVGAQNIATFTFTLTAQQVASYAYYLRYTARHPQTGAAGDAMNQYDVLKVNGNVIAQTRIPYDDTNWHTMTIAELYSSYFQEGSNTIEIVGLWHNIQYDYIEIDGLSPAAASGTIRTSGGTWEGDTLTLAAPYTLWTSTWDPTGGSSLPDGGWEYVWKKNGAAITDPNVTTENYGRLLKITGLTTDNIGSYTVDYVQNEGDTAVSLPYVISEVIPEPVHIPTPVTGLVGLAVLTVSFAGAFGLKLRKQK
jgi:hypothetical protein